jgi:hypothetical protein
MSPELVEILQILKFGLRQDSLSFITDWVWTQDEIKAEENMDTDAVLSI